MNRLFLVFLLTFTLFLNISPQETEQKKDEPKKEEEKIDPSKEITTEVLDPWYSFPNGSFVKLTTKPEQPPTVVLPEGTSMDYTESIKIKSKVEGTVIVEMLTAQSNMEPVKMESQFPIVTLEDFFGKLLSDLRVAFDVKPEFKGIEELSIAGTKIKCYVYVIDSKSESPETTSLCKIWLSKDVPKGVVKKMVNLRVKIENYEETTDEFFELKEHNKSITIAGKKINVSLFEYILNKKSSSSSESQTIKITLSNGVPGKVVQEITKFVISGEGGQSYSSGSEKKVIEFSVPTSKDEPPKK